MPKAAIRFADAALVDLEVLRSGYAEQEIPETGEQLLRETIDRIEVLAEHPEMGRIMPPFEQPFLRELIRPPFRIVYRRDPKHVHIVCVWRSERLLELPDEPARWGRPTS